MLTCFACCAGSFAVQRSSNPESGTSPASVVIDNFERKTSAIRKQVEDLKFELPGNPLTRQQDPATLAAPAGPAASRHIIYRGPWLFLIRFLVRAKVLQILGIFAGVVLVSSAFGSDGQGDAVSPSLAAAVLIGCVVTSYCLWFYSSRYVGEMSLLLPEKRVARFSVLDFWGNRQDVDVPVSDIQPPFQNRSDSEIRQLAKRTLLPITMSTGRQFYLSIPHGIIRDKDHVGGILAHYNDTNAWRYVYVGSMTGLLCFWAANVMQALEKVCYGTWLQHLNQPSSPDHMHSSKPDGSAAFKDDHTEQQHQLNQQPNASSKANASS